jgi:hypothetical protein
MAIAEVLAGHGVDDADGIAVEVLERLTASDIAADLSDQFDQAIMAASDAYTERPDLFDNPFGTRVAGEVAVTALIARVRGEFAGTEIEPGHAAAILGRVTYKGWSVRLVKLSPDSLGVSVIADVENVHDPARTFRTSRTVPIRGNHVEEAVLTAILELEGHEIREQLAGDGLSRLNPHWGANSVAPTNLRR